ncbi:hypothetical protein JMN12_06505 [Capnocytophaga genosp. AHN8471]|jgi:hypothetical protein|uniref:hypothetical protein n=1 Tax=Capnocytophaga genosp. AHN8471 TaxID=327574 RepID=UPI001932E805|nr:hypothetical protein [Capnocytophaga genosp. AHN8471]MBM0656209.1 hypothetical protein [Capnocytophaga genosp. AHN8471]MBM0660047.1 hypothetical protein [Capnocytophaga genosp. AHN8471]
MKQLVKNVTTILIIGVFMVTGGCKKDENTPENNNTEIVNNIRNNYLPLKNKEVDSILRTDYGVNNLEKVDIELVKKDPLIFTRVINRDTLSKDFKFLILIKKKDNQIITFAKKQDNKSIHSRWRFLDEGVPRNFPPPVSGGRYPCGHLDGDPNCIHSVHELEEVVVTGRIVDYYEEIVLIISMYPNFECLMDELDIMYAIDWDGEDSIFNAIEDDRQCLRVYYPPNNSGGGNSGGGNNSEGKQEDNIIDKLNNPCAKALLAKAPNLNNDIAKILRETFGTNNKYNITVTEKPLSGMSGYSSFPEVKQNSIEAIIYLNSNMFGTVTQEYVLATIYHEVIHVFLNAEHAKLGETVFNQKYPSVTYQDYPVGNGQQTRRYKLRTDHSRFDAFLEKLAQSIISFNPNFTLERARAIAKEGIVEDFFISPTDATFIQEQKNGTNGTKCP